MSAGLNQPVGQVLLTNVAILKYKVGDKKYTNS